MAEHEDRKLSERYRELGREEPPKALDEKILAAARRRHGARRWALPLSIAAVIVLSVSVTLQMQREPAQREDLIEKQAEPKLDTAPAAPVELERRVQTPAASAPAAGRLSRESAERERFERAAPAVAEERAKQLSAVESPERWLERIAELRRAGRDDEADRLLAEFRRRFPDYRIPEAALRRVERR
jgi:alkanesulfonate monooxygenase SsuD/methylene tetrahydromethanopterin reductase-like flavin-dependent oxidoreductase (luciferase family)